MVEQGEEEQGEEEHALLTLCRECADRTGTPIGPLSGPLPTIREDD
jgi:hypothetical protein